MCDCVKQFETDLVRHYQPKATEAVMDGKFMNLHEGTTGMGLNVTVTVGKQKKKVLATFSYCPFCGVKYASA